MTFTILFSVLLYGTPFLLLLPPFRHRLWVAAWFFWIIGFGGVIIDFLKAPSPATGSMLPIWMICGPLIGVIYSGLAMGLVEGTRQLLQLPAALGSARARGFSGTALWKEASRDMVARRKSWLFLPKLLQPARIIAIFLATLVSMILAAPLLASRPRSGQDLPSVPWLPPEAKHISFYRSTGNSMFEFEISEAGFLRWMTERKFSGTTNTDGMVRRWTASLKPEQLGTNSTLQHITNGFVVENRQANGGGYSVGYDRTIGRGFVSENSH